MERKLILLGTGNAMAVKCYNTCFAMKNGENWLLVDAGGGNTILSRMEDAGIAFEQIHEMFVTHAHTDHVLGVVWVIRKIAALMNQGSYEGNLHIYCHSELAGVIDQLCRLTLIEKFTRHLGERILLCQVEDGQSCRAAGMELTFFDIGSTKTKQYGFCASFDGTRTDLVCAGDEPIHERTMEYARGCGLLMSEAFCLDADKEIFKPYEKHHSTAMDVGRLAAQLGVNSLLLYHTEDSCLEKRRERYTAEAAAGYSGRIYVPLDLEEIDLNEACGTERI